MKKEIWIKLVADQNYIHQKIQEGKFEEIKTEGPDIWERLQKGNEMMAKVLEK
jgi:hypothetical protein